MRSGSGGVAPLGYPADMTAIDPEERLDQIDVLLTEVQVRLDALSTRAEATSTRASVLVASAAIALTLIDLGVPDWAQITALTTGLFAVVLGIYALLPGTAGYTPLLKLRTDIYVRGIAKAKLLVVDDKIRFYNSSVKRLSRRAWAVRIGYACLAASVAIAGIGFIWGGE